jgi:precorrin-3B synthase
MPTRDGKLVRLRPPGGQMSTTQLETLADASARFGNGIVELTGQARLQVRGLSDATLPDFTAAMVQAGLASADPRVELRRRVILLPCGDAALAARVEAALLACDITLAEKFAVLVGVDDEAPADITLHQGLLWLAGATSAVRVQQPLDAIVRIIGGLAGARAPALDPATLYRAAGLTADAAIPRNASPSIGPSGGGFGVGVTFGTLTSTDLRALAALGERHGNSRWHLTRNRALHLNVVFHPRAVAADAAAAGFIVQPSDPRRRISACIGQPGCASGTIDARAEALRWLPSLAEGLTLHVAGCTKACGRPHNADITRVEGHDVFA